MSRPSVRETLSLLALVGVAAAFLACEPDGERIAPPQDEESQLGLQVLALESCAQGATLTPDSVHIVVRGPAPCPSELGLGETCVQELASKRARWGAEVKVGGIPEGADREVSIYACAPSGGVQDDAHCEGRGLVGFARATDVTIRKGESADIETVLTRFGGVSCPSIEGEFLPRVFASATPVADGRVVVAGGFTSVSESGGAVTLAAPDDGVYVYDPKTGDLSRAASLSRARGAHGAAYLQGLNQVVFLGGAGSLPLNASAGAFPFRVAAGDGFDDYEIFDLATGEMVDKQCPSAECGFCCQTDGTLKPDADAQCVQAAIDCSRCCFECGEGRRMFVPRVFPEPMVMSDDFVVVTGGGDFPDHGDADYRRADVFDPFANCGTGAFQDAGLIPRTEAIRAGHATAFLGANEAGRHRFLLWGGTRESVGAAAGASLIGETYLESSQQYKGISGVFRRVYLDTPELAKNLYFHSLTPLDDERFLLLGGVRRDGSGFAAPERADAYLMTIEEDEESHVRLEALDSPWVSGRFLHSASSHDGRRVVVLGGYGALGGQSLGLAATGSGEASVFDLGAGARFAPLRGDTLAARAGHRAVVLPDDSVLFVGGMNSTSDLSGSGRGSIEVFTPSILGSW